MEVIPMRCTRHRTSCPLYVHKIKNCHTVRSLRVRLRFRLASARLRLGFGSLRLGFGSLRLVGRFSTASTQMGSGTIGLVEVYLGSAQLGSYHFNLCKFAPTRFGSSRMSSVDIGQDLFGVCWFASAPGGSSRLCSAYSGSIRCGSNRLGSNRFGPAQRSSASLGIVLCSCRLRVCSGSNRLGLVRVGSIRFGLCRLCSARRFGYLGSSRFGPCMMAGLLE
jgi:hypothetical protein